MNEIKLETEQTHSLTDGIWTVDVVVDVDGRLCVWVSAKDGDTPLNISDDPDLFHSYKEWGTRFCYQTETVK